MEVVTLTSRMDDFLGKVYVSCIPHIRPVIETDKIRILNIIDIREKDSYPALFYGIIPGGEYMREIDRIALRLLDERQIGLIVDAYEARELYKFTGRRADGVILYGDESFWREVARAVKRYGLAEEEVLSLVGLFKGHIASLRILFGDTASWKVLYREVKRGKRQDLPIEYVEETLLLRWEMELLDKLHVYQDYGIPEKLSDLVINTMLSVNLRFMEYIDIREERPSLPGKVWIRLKDPSDTEFKEVIKMLRTLHPEAVEVKSEDFIYVHALF